MVRAGHPALYPAILAHLFISPFTYIVAKYAVGAMPVPAVALLRFYIAAVALSLLWLGTGGRPGQFSARDWRGLAWLGLLAVPLNQGMFLWGMQRSSPAHAALFFATTPLLVLLAGVLRGEDRFTWLRLGGLLAALAGVLLVLLDRGLALDRRHLAGDLLMLVAVVAWALYSVESQARMREHPPITVTAVSLVLGALMTLPAAPWVFGDFRPAAYPAAAWGAVLFLGLVTSVLSYYLWVWCLSRTEASRVAVFSNFQPVLTTVLAWLLFHERFAPHFFVGGALVLAGVGMVQWSGGRAAAPGSGMAEP
ncbi:MAG: DMT family transporter [Candidatus Eisenbacteria bacterium]|nr:DMT family transporter [Candidatus Eisenbacteria bacterium]